MGIDHLIEVRKFDRAVKDAMNDQNNSSSPMRFGSIKKADLPYGRNGRHKGIVEQLLSDIAQLEPGEALKVPLADLPDSKVNIRSALNRATQQRGIIVATSSDAENFYIWKPEAKADGKS